MDISGRTRIFKNDFNGRTSYCTTVSSKKQDGTYDKVYVPVTFTAQCIDTDGDIDITKGFVSMFKDRNGLGKIKFVVQEYRKVEKVPFSGEVVEDDLNLPF